MLTSDTLNRKQDELHPTSPIKPETSSSYGEIGGNLNVMGLVWILAVVVCAASATAATMVVATVLKVQCNTFVRLLTRRPQHLLVISLTSATAK